MFVSVSSLGLTRNDYVEKNYGTSHRWLMGEDIYSLDFIPKGNSNKIVLWKDGDPGMEITDYHERQMAGVFRVKAMYQLTNLTPKDSGLYTVRNNDKAAVRTTTLEVIGEDPSHGHFMSFPLLTVWLTLFSSFFWFKRIGSH